ncbi:MAG: hypothetical protein ACRDRB_11285 [Pseudonocardiaceae bacterium]
MVNAYLALDLPKVWGTASSVAADGTKYDIYVDNLGPPAISVGECS